MANQKVLQAIVEIAGSVSPTLQKAVKETGEKLGKVNMKAVAIGAAAAGGAVAIGKAAIDAGKYLVDLGSQFDNATDSIRIGTGATGEALEGLMDDFDAVYSSVPTTMEDASKAIADYNTRLGLTGNELQGVSTQAIQVADMLGEDLGGVIESSSQAFQQWNIDADKMGGAMDYVFKASQSTGVGFTDLMGTVQSFGPQLQEMGYSFEEATALIGQMEKAGVNTEEVLGAMKKSTAALAKEGIGASDGLDMYAKAIMNAKDMTEATNIASEVFGTRAASTMAAALRDGSISADQLTKSLMDSEETISGCATDTYDYAEQLQIFKQKAQVALEPLAATMFNSLNELMPVVSDLMEGLIPIIQELATTLVPLITDLIADIGPMLAEFIPPLLRMASTIAGQVIPPLVNIISMIFPMLIQLAQMLMPLIEFIAVEILPIIVEVIEKLLPPIMTIIEVVLPIVMGLLDALMPVLFQIIDAVLPVVVFLIEALAEVLEFLSPIIQWVAELFSGYLQNALSVVQPIIEGLTGVFQNLIGFITNVFSGNWSAAWDNIVGYFKSVWETMKAIFKAPINWIVGGINAFIKGLNKLKIPDWVPVVGGKGINIPLIPQLATGGFTDGISIAGEAGMEAVISFDPAYHDENVGYWQRAGELLGVYNESETAAQESPLVAQAGKLMQLDDFSLGGLTETTIIYYDFSGFKYAPQVAAGGNVEKEDIVAALKEHASEFFDWLDEWLAQKEVGEYDRVSIY